MYPGKADSEGGDRGEGNRSSSRRSLSPCLKAMVGRAKLSNYTKKSRPVSETRFVDADTGVLESSGETQLRPAPEMLMPRPLGEMSE